MQLLTLAVSVTLIFREKSLLKKLTAFFQTYVLMLQYQNHRWNLIKTWKISNWNSAMISMRLMIHTLCQLPPDWLILKTQVEWLPFRQIVPKRTTYTYATKLCLGKLFERIPYHWSVDNKIKKCNRSLSNNFSEEIE